MNHPICIIDDDVDVRGVMAFALEFEGMNSLPFEGGKQAEEYLAKLPLDKLPCLIIVDYMMPEMNGLELISLLKEKYPNTLGKIPVILSTARLTDDLVDLPDHLVTLEKPIELDEFLLVAREHYSLPEKSFLF